MWKVKEKSIFISNFKIDVPPVLEVLGKGGEPTTPLTAIYEPEIWDSCDGVRVV